jgi:hypothetical protein
MGYELAQTCVSLVAAADLSALQFTFVIVDGDGKAAANISAGGWAFGVLQNKPIAGETAQVAIAGVTKIVAGATITPDDKIMSTNAGKADVAVAAASPGNFARGQALEGGASGEIITMALAPTGYMTNAT